MIEKANAEKFICILASSYIVRIKLDPTISQDESRFNILIYVVGYAPLTYHFRNALQMLCELSPKARLHIYAPMEKHYAKYEVFHISK